MKAAVVNCVSFGYSKKVPVFYWFALGRSTAFFMISNGWGSLIFCHFRRVKYITGDKWLNWSWPRLAPSLSNVSTLRGSGPWRTSSWRTVDCRALWFEGTAQMQKLFGGPGVRCLRCLHPWIELEILSWFWNPPWWVSSSQNSLVVELGWLGVHYLTGKSLTRWIEIGDFRPVRFD